MLHMITTKGKGMQVAEENPVKYPGVSKKQSPSSLPPKEPTYTQCFESEIIEIAKEDKSIHVITPAMREGSGLVEYEQQFPDRYYDVGIAEEHAITFARLSRGGVSQLLRFTFYNADLIKSFMMFVCKKSTHGICTRSSRFGWR